MGIKRNINKRKRTVKKGKKFEEGERFNNNNVILNAYYYYFQFFFYINKAHYNKM